MSLSCHPGLVSKVISFLKVNPKSTGCRKALGKKIFKINIYITMEFLVLSFELLDSDSGMSRDKTQYNVNYWSEEMQQSVAKSCQYRVNTACS